MLAQFHAKSIDLHIKTGLPSVLHMPGHANRNLNAALRFRAGQTIVPVLLLLVCAGPMFAGVPKPQRHETRHQIDHLEEVWRTALLKGDISMMSSLMAEDYMAITPTGILETRDESLANLRAGSMHITSIDISDRKVRLYGNTAVVTSLADVHGTASDGAFSGSYRYTRVYVRDAQGAWKIVSFEASRIAQLSEPK